jgi:excisionase family DNA binding protein
MSDTAGGTNGGTVRYSVPEAARYLGISERAVRKRIDAGTLAAERNGSRWVVFLKAVPGSVQGDTGGGTDAVSDPNLIEAQYRITPEVIEQTIERTGDKYVADITALAERFDQLYAGRLADKDELIAEVRRRAEQVEDERDHERRRAEIAELEQAGERQLREALESRVRELEAQRTESPPTLGENAPETSDQRPWWRRWWG